VILSDSRAPEPISTIPVVYLSVPPPDASGFARYRTALEELLAEHEVRAALVISAHRLEPGESPNPRLHAGAGPRPVDDAAVIFAEAVAARLAEAGLQCDFEEGTGRRSWPAAMAAFGSSALPVLHLSLPVNFGPDLMILAGVALAPLREAGVLLAATGDAFDERVRAGIGRRHLARAKAWARGEAPGHFRGVHPLLFMMGASGEADRLVDVGGRRGGIVALSATPPVEFDLPRLPIGERKERDDDDDTEENEAPEDDRTAARVDSGRRDRIERGADDQQFRQTAAQCPA
jgi:hypothetical protein